jgi:hypothetical protein
MEWSIHTDHQPGFSVRIQYGYKECSVELRLSGAATQPRPWVGCT